MKLFISYSRDDKAWVYELWRASRDRLQHDAWIDQQLVPAQDWWEAILQAIENAEAIIYVMTPKSVGSIYCQAEVNYALALGKPIVPLMLKQCDVPAELRKRRIQYQMITDSMSLSDTLLLTERGLGAVQVSLVQGKYPALAATRPDEPVPQKQPEQMSEVFTLAERAAYERNYSLAEAKFQQVIDADPQGWGVAAAERLADIRLERDRNSEYQTILQMANSPATLKGARAAARGFAARYGQDYDPNNILAGLLTPSSATPTAPAPPVLTPAPARKPQATPSVSEQKQSTVAPITKQPSKRHTIGLIPIIAVAATVIVVAGIVLSQSGTLNTAPTIAPVTNIDLLTPTTISATVTDLPMITAVSATDSPILSTPQPVTINNEWIPQIRSFDGVDMVLVPPGCFQMGDKNDSNIGDGRMQCFKAPFWIDKTPVWQAQFKQLNGVAVKPSYFSGDMLPVESITWFEASNYCIQKRGGRLLTEKEWEYAARGPDDLHYPFGNGFDLSKAVYSDTSNNKTVAVNRTDRIAPSWVGATDMGGNVWQWTGSLYKPYPYDPTDGREDQSASGDRSLRGGAWGSGASDLRSVFRSGDSPSLESSSSGFRCARSF